MLDRPWIVLPKRRYLAAAELLRIVIGRLAHEIFLPSRIVLNLRQHSVLSSEEAMRPLCFIHIPRTGGTTVKSVLRKHYRRKEIHVIKQFGHWPDAVDPSVRVIMGHMNYGIHQLIPVDYATILRDPVERCISRYRLRIERKGERGDFDRFLSKEPDMRNGQSQILAGVLHTEHGLTGEQILDRAKRNLETFRTVGFTDNLPAFFEAIGIPAKEIPHRNLSKADAGPAESMRTEIVEVNRIDIALYKWARRRFRRRSILWFLSASTR